MHRLQQMINYTLKENCYCNIGKNVYYLQKELGYLFICILYCFSNIV